MTKRTFPRRALLLSIVSSLFLALNPLAGKIFISAQFTRGFVIGACVILDAFAVVWLIRAAYNLRQQSADVAGNDE